MTQHMDTDEFKKLIGKKRARQPKREIPDTMTGDELRKHLETGDLDQQCRDAGLPEPVREMQFHLFRKWRFDYAWPNHSPKVAVEIDGGIYTQGRHTRGSGFEKDMEKLNSAAVMGWAVYRFTPDQVRNGTALNELRAVLK